MDNAFRADLLSRAFTLGMVWVGRVYLNAGCAALEAEQKRDEPGGSDTCVTPVLGPQPFPSHRSAQAQHGKPIELCMGTGPADIRGFLAGSWVKRCIFHLS